MIPSLGFPARNTKMHIVCFGRLYMYFSYSTIVAASYDGDTVQRANVWGPTTGRHLREWGFDSRAGKHSEDEVHAFVERALILQATQELQEKFL